MNTTRSLRYLIICLITLFMLVSCGGGGSSGTTSTSTAQNASSGGRHSNEQGADDQDSDDHAGRPDNLQYIKSASVVIKELWLYDTEGNKLELLKGKPKTVQLVPAADNFASMFLELGDLTPGEYRRARLVLSSGEVLLTDNAYIAQNPWQEEHGRDDNAHHVSFERGELNKKKKFIPGPLFTTQLGNLKFPSGHRRGIKVRIEPPIKVVTNLEPSLLVLHFDLNRSFVFNGSPSKQPGVRRILFKPYIRAHNDSTHGMVSLNGLLGSSAGVKCLPSEVLPGATVSANDTSGNNPGVSTTTDAKGDARLILLPGHYTVSISKTGYESVSQEVDVFAANYIALGNNITLNKPRNVAVHGFDKDVAILMAIMSDVAYQTNDVVVPKSVPDYKGDPNNAPEEYYDDLDWLQRAFQINSHPDSDIVLPTSIHYIENYKSSVGIYGQYENGEAVTTEYQGQCWRLKHYKEYNGFANTTQYFVAYKPSTGDIVVSFQGTQTGAGNITDGAYNDIITDLNIVKSPWTFRTGNEANWDNRAGNTALLAVHTGAKNSYLSIADDLKTTLDTIITNNVRNPSVSRVYFTGHSLGSMLSTLAAVDFTKYLQVRYHYNKNNIMMYGIATPRVITKMIQSEYQSLVPNSYAISAKDDVYPYFPGASLGLFPTDYTHLNQLVIISTNLPASDIVRAKEDYIDIGNSRLEYSYRNSAGFAYPESIHYGGCNIGFKNSRNVGFLSMFPFSKSGDQGNDYWSRGHNHTNYIQRLVSSYPDGQGIPRVGLYKPDKHLVLGWTGGVQGPCDRVRLFEVPAGTIDKNIRPADKNYLCTASLLGGGAQWVVNGSGYAQKPPGVTSTYTTCENPDTIDQKNPVTGKYYVDFWVEYVDGFGNVLAMNKYRP